MKKIITIFLSTLIVILPLLNTVVKASETDAITNTNGIEYILSENGKRSLYTINDVAVSYTHLTLPTIRLV